MLYSTINHKSAIMQEGQFFRIILIVLVSILIISCSKEEEVEIFIEHEDPSLIDIGEYNLLLESINLIPYLSKSEIIFVDTLNNQTTFRIEESDLLKAENSVLYRYDVNIEGDTVRYKYSGEVKRFVIWNDSLNIEFQLILKAQPYYPDPEKRYVADVIEIFCRNNENPNSANQVYYNVINQRTWPQYASVEFSEIMEFNGNVFSEVYYNKFNSPKLNLYYNNEFGIIAFQDFNFNLWSFEDLN